MQHTFLSSSNIFNAHCLNMQINSSNGSEIVFSEDQELVLQGCHHHLHILFLFIGGWFCIPFAWLTIADLALLGCLFFFFGGGEYILPSEDKQIRVSSSSTFQFKTANSDILISLNDLFLEVPLLISSFVCS